MRSIWTGAVTFGLITIPVKLYTAVSEDRVHFRLLHGEDGGAIHYQRVCEKDGEVVEWDDIVKGYEYEEGEYVTFTHEELDELDVDTMRTIDIDTFVRLEDVDPVLYDRAYYVAPAEGGEKPYRLLTQTLAEQELVGVAKFAMRDKEHLCALRATNGMLLVQTLHWPAEVRDPDELEQLEALGKVKISSRERSMAGTLVEQLTGEFEPDRYRNDFERKIKRAAKRKAEGKEIVRAPEREEQPEVADLMQMLEASLAQMKGGKSGGAADGGEPPRSRAWMLDHTKDELYELARKADIPGRSDMTKDELVDALSKE